MTHLPRAVQVLHLDASWLLNFGCNESMLKDEERDERMMIKMMDDG